MSSSFITCLYKQPQIRKRKVWKMAFHTFQRNVGKSSVPGWEGDVGAFMSFPRNPTVSGTWLMFIFTQAEATSCSPACKSKASFHLKCCSLYMCLNATRSLFKVEWKIPQTIWRRGAFLDARKFQSCSLHISLRTVSQTLGQYPLSV